MTLAKKRQTDDSTSFVSDNQLPDSHLRLRAVDALRGLAALCVVLHHTSWVNHMTGWRFFRNAYAAVDLFFILSGLVIAAAYSGRIDTRAKAVVFLGRRLFRIIPLHWAVLGYLFCLEAAKLVVQVLGHQKLNSQAAFAGNYSVESLLANVFLVQGVGIIPYTSWNFPSWSISAEMVLYVVFACVSLTGILNRPTSTAFLIVSGLSLYLMMAVGNDTLDLTVRLGLVRCLGGFMLGVALYRLASSGLGQAYGRLGYRSASLWEIGALASSCVVLATADNWDVVLVIPCFAIVLFVFWFGRGAVSRVLSAKPFQVLGALSYSIYLVHIPIRELVFLGTQRFGVAGFRSGSGGPQLAVSPLVGDVLLALLLAAVLATSLLTFRFVEEPARLLGRRIFRI